MSGGRTLRQSDDSSLGIHSSTGRGPTVPHPALSATAHLSPKFSLSFFIDRTCGIQNTFISGKINPDKNTINRLFEPLPPSFRPGLPTSLSPATHYSSREISPLNREHRYNIERNHINQEQRPEKPTLLSNLTHSHKSPLPTSTGSTNTLCHEHYLRRSDTCGAATGSSCFSSHSLRSAQSGQSQCLSCILTSNLES